MTGTRNVQTLYYLMRSGNEQPEIMNALLDMIRNDTQSRRVYLQLVHLEINLPWVLESGQPIELAIHQKMQQRHARTRLAGIAKLGSLIVAVSLLLAVGIQHHYWRIGARFDVPVMAASLDVSGDVVIAGKVPGASPSMLKLHDSLILMSGSVLMRSSRGTLMVATGPAVLEFIDPSSIKLDRGTVLADVAAGDHGFNIKTPTRRFIDLGTQFGVNVDHNGRCEMHVFSGRVSVLPPSQSSATKPVEVETGGSVAFSQQGQSLPPQDPDLIFHDALTRREGIVHIEGAARLLTHPPASVRMGDLINQDEILIIREQVNVPLRRPLRVMPSRKGEQHSIDEGSEIDLPEDMTCCAYLVHCQQVSSGNLLTATIQFEQPILGVIASHSRLFESDEVFARSDMLYPVEQELALVETKEVRGCELRPQKGGSANDRIQIHADAKTVTLTLESSAAGIDQIRLITGATFNEK